MEGVEERTLGGVARSEVVKPGRVGGTWYPERMDGRWEEQSVGRKGGVVLMFHGGAVSILFLSLYEAILLMPYFGPALNLSAYSNASSTVVCDGYRPR